MTTSGEAADDCRLRIALITSELYPRYGGIESYVSGLATDLAQRHLVALVAEPGQYLEDGGAVVDLLRVPLARVGSVAEEAASGAALRRALRDFAPDVVHLASAGLAVYAGSFPPGVPWVVTVHGNDFTRPWQRVPGHEPRPRILAGLHGCAAVIAVSRYTAELARQHGISAPLTVIPPACDPVQFSPRTDRAEARRRLGLPTAEAIVLTVGRLAPRKGHLFLIEALSLARNPFHWVIAGDGKLRFILEDAVAASPLASRCSVLGRVADLELADYYAACDVFVTAPECRATAAGLDSEGYGLVLAEAAACARPVLSSAAGGVTEAVLDGRTGLLVEPRDPVVFAAALDRLLADQELRLRLGREGRRRAVLGQGWSAVARATEAVYAAAGVAAAVVPG